MSGPGADARMPDFMIIGAAKSGTSSLFEYLCRHPNIYIPPVKEPEFFSRKSVYSKGLSWYQNLFAEARPDQLCGDASTTYSRWPHTLDSPDLIAKTLSDTKFIYIMRHPVERAYSHYRHHMRECITMTFEQALKKSSIYIDCSMYYSQIERYLRFFPKENFLFLFQKDLRENPIQLFDKIEGFLGIDRVDLTSDGVVKRNIGGSDVFIRSKTTVQLRKIPFMDYISQKIPKSFRDLLYTSIILKSPVGKRLKGKHQVPPMLPETRSKLLDLFKKPNDSLEKFLDISLSEWSS